MSHIAGIYSALSRLPDITPEQRASYKRQAAAARAARSMHNGTWRGGPRRDAQGRFVA